MEEKILNILCKVNKDICWDDDYLDEIQSEMEKAQNAPGEGNDPDRHLIPILPKYWEVFHTHNIYRRCNGSLLCPAYDIGIFLVGFSSLPIVLSLAEINPREKIYFIYSSDTEKVLNEINNRIAAMLQFTNPSLVQLVEDTVLKHWEDTVLKIKSPSNPIETFKRIKRVIDEVSGKRIALDITGGKKTMIGGGFTAGSILGFSTSVDMFYVDSLEYNVNRGRPEWGTEFLSQLENPYDVYNVQSTQEAKKLFEKHNYEAAADLWEEVEKKLTTPVRMLQSPAEQYGLKDEQKMVQSDLAMANCYKLWDAFDYKKAKNYKSFSFSDPDADGNSGGHGDITISM